MEVMGGEHRAEQKKKEEKRRLERKTLNRLKSWAKEETGEG